MIRVAVDATALLGSRSGVGQFVFGALSALAEGDVIDVAAFAVTWRRRGLLSSELPPGVRSVGRPMPARPLHLAWSLVDLPPIEAFIGRTDVVHGTNFVVPPTMRARRVVTVHDLTPLRFPEMCHPSVLAFPSLVRRAIVGGAVVHTPSEFVRSEVINLLGADPSKVYAIAHGVPTRLFSQDDGAPSRWRGGVEGRYLLAIGTIEPRKDYPSLLKAFDIIAAHDQKIRLVIAGARGWGYDAFVETLKSLRFGDRVQEVGYVNETERAQLLEGASAFIYPSLYEGFGLPPLEAMDFAVPVVATAAGAVPEVVGDAAVLVPVRDPRALADATIAVLEDTALRSKLIAAGRERVELFTWKRSAQELAAMYGDIVES